jgi:hypothetical protein
MTSRAVASAALLAILATACTAQEHSEPKTQPASGGSAAGSGSGQGQDGRPGDAASEDGPLTVDGHGSLCIDTTINRKRQFTYGEDLLETTAPVQLESVALVRSRGIRVLRAWTFPSRGVPYTGDWSGWPLPELVISHGRLEWDERVTAEGSQLVPGRRYNFLVRMLREPGNGVQGFDAIRVTYQTNNRSHVLKTRTTVWFRKDCR